jgi:hypothetical protein
MSGAMKPLQSARLELPHLTVVSIRMFRIAG